MITKLEYIIVAVIMLTLLVVTSKAKSEDIQIFESESMFDTSFIPSKTVTVNDYGYKKEIKVYDHDEYGVRSNPVPEKTIRIEVKGATSLPTNSPPTSLPLTVSDLLR